MGESLKIFVYEHASGGRCGSLSAPFFPNGQGEMLLRCLLMDLLAVPGIEILMMRDARSPAICLPISKLVVSEQGKFEECFKACVDESDAVWLLAPETNGILENLSRVVVQRERILLGCCSHAIHIAGSKVRTARTLAQAEIPVVGTYTAYDRMPHEIGACVVKPDDGVGCLDTRIFTDTKSAFAWMMANGKTTYVLQPYVFGKHCSLSLLCCGGTSWMLGFNEQRLVVADNQFRYLGCTVNGIADSSGELTKLAHQTIRAMPKLWGYVGIDLIMTARGAVILEVNPGITMPWIGLHASLKINPAQLVLRMLDEGENMKLPDLIPVPVNVDLETFDLP